jgi:hypothetical protein
MSENKIKELFSTKFSSSFFAFTFFFAVAIYILAISFYFWLLRTDIKPEKS